MSAFVPKFPGALADNSWLTVATNQLQTTLAIPCGVSDMTIGVADASRIVQWSLLTLNGATSGSTSTVSEIVLVTAPPSGNIVTVQRGYDGTVPAAHASGSTVSGNVVAWHQKSLAAEVEAIEQTLGPNLSNVSSGLPSVYVSSKYNFTPQFPGGNLAVGNNSITHVPVPPGVNGSDQNHYLYIDQGTGTAEPVLITGGSAVAGATSGTIIVNCKNAHSGAWRISSATAGIQEAAIAPNICVVVPPGSYNIYGTITPAQGVTIDGFGRPSDSGPSGAVNLHLQTAGIPLINIVNSANTIKNLQISYGTFPAYTVGGAPATAGSVGIQSGVTSTVDEPYLFNIYANNFYNNFKLFPGEIYGEKLWSLASVSHGFLMGALGSGYMINVYAESSGGDGFHLLPGSSALQWTNVAGFNNKGWAFYVEDGAAFQMDNFDFEGDYAGGCSIGNTGVNAILQNGIIQSEGDQSTGTNPTASGISIRAGSTQSFAAISNVQIANCQGNGLEVLAPVFASVTGSYFYNNGLGAASSHNFNVYSIGTFVSIVNCKCQSGQVLLNGQGTIFANNTVYNTTAPAAASITFGSSSTGTIFTGNYVDNAGGGVAVIYTAGSTFSRGFNEIAGTVTGTPGYTGSTFAAPLLQQLPAPTALTVSGNAIAPTLPVHHVGAGLIKSITQVASGGISYALDLIADAAFTTDTTGNIATAAITAVPGQVYRAVYDNALSKWYIR